MQRAEPTVTDVRELMKLARLLYGKLWATGPLNWDAKCDSSRCPGWLVSGPADQVQRCDACERFESDDAAMRHVIRGLRNQGWLGAAPCGDAACELCYLEMNRPGQYLDEETMSPETRKAHQVLFAIMGEDADDDWDWERR
jgi:hypothetical protein